MEELCREATRAVEEAISDGVGGRQAGKVVSMGADGTPTKQLDRAADEAALGVFSNRGDIEVVSEESGSNVYGDPEYVVALDPLDGTYNAVNDIPFYSVSIAVSTSEELKDVFYCYVKELPRGNTFTAKKQEGAYLNGESVSVSDESTLSRMTVCGVYNIEGFDPSRFKRVRLLGCSSLEMCYTGMGAMDGFVDVRGYLRAIDFAAGKLFIEEAGGVVTDRNGESITGEIKPRTTSSMVAGPRNGHDGIIELVGEK